MISNNNSKLERDVKLYRGLMILLAIGLALISLDYFGHTECYLFSGVGGSLLSRICGFIGSSLTGLFLLLLGAFLIGHSFSKKLKKKLRELYS